MKKKEILKITVNRAIDRRIINEARILAEDNFLVNILARNDDGENSDEYNLVPNVSINRFKTPEIHHTLKTGLSLKFYRSLKKQLHRKSGKASIYPWDKYIMESLNEEDSLCRCFSIIFYNHFL
jgi:hypothetical protein